MDKELLCRYIQCRTTKDEEAEILKWLETDSANQRILADLYAKMETLTLLDARIEDLYAESRRLKARRNRIVRWSASAAAVLVLCAGSIFVTADRIREQVYEDVGSHVQKLTAQDSPLRFTLTDGTTIWLNAGASMECPAVFTGHERTVRITGEALFDVAPDPAHPFVVRTAACDVRVLGTKFNVVADIEGKIFETALLRGRIEVVNRVTHERLVLGADESAALKAGALVRGRIADADDYQWTDGFINLKGHSFEELLATFRRTFNVRIDTGDMPMPEGRYKWGKIRIADGLDHAMKVLQNSYPFDYTFDSEHRVVVIRPR